MDARDIIKASLLLVTVFIGAWGCTPDADDDTPDTDLKRVYQCHMAAAPTAGQINEALVGRWVLATAAGGGTVCQLTPGTSALDFDASGELRYTATAGTTTQHTWKLTATPTASGQTTLFQIEATPAIQALRGYVYLCGMRLAIDHQQPYYCQFEFEKE